MRIHSGLFRRKPEFDCERPAENQYAEAGRAYVTDLRIGRRRTERKLLRATAWTIVTLAAMGGTVDLLLNPPAFLLQPPATTGGENPGWTQIRKPIPVYAFSGGQYDRDPDTYTARRHTDGSRIDTVTYGQFGGSAKPGGDWMRISLYRPGNGFPPLPGFFVDMARLASTDGLAVKRHTFPNIIRTRFGEFAVSDMEISNGKSSETCLGYRMRLDKPAFQVAGIVCAAQHAPLDRRALACIIDRLDLLSSRDDQELSRFFSNSELKRREHCSRNQLAMKKRSAWLDQVKPDKALSALRLVSLPAVKRRRR